MVHFTALDPSEKSSGRKLRVARLSPRPRTTWAVYWSICKCIASGSVYLRDYEYENRY